MVLTYLDRKERAVLGVDRVRFEAIRINTDSSR
jgi:hypothetical protein